MRSSYGKPLSPILWKTERGSISVPFLLLTLVLTAAAISAAGYALAWRTKMGLQLRLDRCVESTALDLIQIQNLIEASNFRMKTERAAALAAAIPTAGGSLKAAKLVLAAEKMLQEALRLKWKAREARWILKRGCDGKRDLFFPLPKIFWWRLPDDSIGALPLQWKGQKRSGLKIRLWQMNRFAQAEVFAGKEDSETEEEDGKSESSVWEKVRGERWTGRFIPRFGSWANTH